VKTRETLIMHIDMDEAPEAVTFPDEIDLITYAEHPHLEDFVRIKQASFQDHRGYVAEPLENEVARWQTWIDGSDDFTAELLMMLKEGDNDVGAIFVWPSSEEDAERGTNAVLGITRSYRRRGLALKVLRHAFRELYLSGVHKAILGVDGASLTGATKLYEKAGMHVAHVYHAYDLELRPGIEYSNQGQQTETVVQ
jgi:GNAT superfamily N-acetyltransferase